MLHTTAGSTGRVEIDLADLDPDEFFTLTVMRGENPESDPSKRAEYMNMRRRMTPAEAALKLRLGVEKLMARGFLDYDRDESGRILTAKDAAGVDQPIIKQVGVIITRVSEFDPSKFMA